MTLNVNEVIIGSTYLLLGPHALIWALFHFRKMYQDLYTTDRKSLSHRRAKPKITGLYKMMSFLTTISIFCLALNLVSAMVASNFTTCGPYSTIPTLAIVIFSNTGKHTMYLVYIARLHQCYSQSAFGYARKKLKCIAITLITLETIYVLGAFVGIIVDADILFSDADGSFPYYCSYLPAQTIFKLFSVCIILTDIIMCIGSMIAFVLPIRRLLQTAKDLQATSQHSNKNRKYEKMLYAGFKYKVCVWMADATSLIWMSLLFAGTPIIVISILSGVDSTIKIFCLALMTPYYPDDIYYQRLCKLCICCCGRQSYKSNASGNNRKDVDEERRKEFESSSVNVTQVSSTGSIATTTVSTTGQTNTLNTKSVDTMDAVQIVAAQNDNTLLSASGNYNNES